MEPELIRRRIAELAPWFYPFELGPGLSTIPKITPEIVEIFHCRLAMIRPLIEAHFGSRLRDVASIDVGCHEGFYSIALARMGLSRVLGIDVRESNVVKARFVAEALGLRNVEFRVGNCEHLASDGLGSFELCLMLGLLYHLENPVLALRNAFSITSEMCIVETQVIDEVEGRTEWGGRGWTREYQGIMAVIDESGEFCAGNPEAGTSAIGLCPSRRALQFLLRAVGFRRIQVAPPPLDGYEQHVRGKRVVFAAYK